MHRVIIERINKNIVINPIVLACKQLVPKTRLIKSVLTIIHKNNVIVKTFKNCP